LKNANLEKTSLEDIKKANDDLVKSILKVAQSRAAANELAEIYAKELDQQARLETIRLNIEKEMQEFIKTDPSPAQIEGKRKGLEGYLILAQDQIDKENETLAIRKKVALSFLDETQAVNDLTDGYKDNTKEVEKNEDAVVKASNERIKRISAEIKAIEKLANVELEYRADILEAQRKVLEEQDAYLKSRTDALTTESERVLSEINDIFFKTIPSSEQVEKLSDGYRDFFEVIDKAIRSGEYDITADGALGLNNLLQFAEKDLPGIGERLKNVGEEDLQSLINYFGTLKDTITELNPNVGTQYLGPGAIFKAPIPGEVIDSYRKVEEEFVKIQNAQLAAGLTNEQLQKALTGAALQNIKTGKEQLTLQEQIERINDKIFRMNYDALVQNRKITDEEKAQIETYREQQKKLYELAEAYSQAIQNNNDFITGLRQVGEEADKNKAKIDANKAALEAPLSPEALDGIKQYFKGQAENFDTILTDIFNNTEKYVSRLGVAGIDALFQGLAEGLPEVEGQTREELEKLVAYFQIVGDELAEALSLPENPFKKFIDEAKAELDTLPTAADEAFTQMVDDLNRIADIVIQVFNNISSRIQGILQQQTSMALEDLQYRQEATLAAIGEANSESAEENEKILAERAKAEKKYAKQRFELEKQARVQELQFGLANAIAAGAQAVIQALALPAPPPLPQLYAGVIGGLSAVEIALIRDQLQSAQSRVFIGRRGGLISGADHEAGGVPALLEGGEFVMSRAAVDNYGDIIGSLNGSVGGRALQIDDSRIVQAISSQNTSKTPIKTYVLYNDIQSTDKLNKKIENLAKL